MGPICVIALSLVCYIMYEIDFLRKLVPGKVMENMGKIWEMSWKIWGKYGKCHGKCGENMGNVM